MKEIPFSPPKLKSFEKEKVSKVDEIAVVKAAAIEASKLDKVGDVKVAAMYLRTFHYRLFTFA